MEVEPTMAAKAKMSLDILNNLIVETKYKSNHILPIVMEWNAKVDHNNKCQKYCEWISQLDKKCGQAFSMIRGQCIQLLLDNMKHDPDWDTKSEY